MKRKYILMFLLFSFVIVSLSCVNAEEQLTSSETDYAVSLDVAGENDVADTIQSQTEDSTEPVLIINPIENVNPDENIEVSGTFNEELLSDRDVGGTLQIAFIYDENQKAIIENNFEFDSEMMDSCTFIEYYSFGDAPYTHMIVTDDNGNLGDFYAIDNYGDGKYNFTYKAYTSGNIKVEVLYDYYAFDGSAVTITNTTNVTVSEKTADDKEDDNDNNVTNSSDKIVKDNNIKPSSKKVHRVSYNAVNYNSPKRTVLKQGNNVILSWINNLFNREFNNKELLIYIDDILVYNGTVSDDPYEVLFKVLEEYKGEHLLKIVEADNTYQKAVTII